MSNLFKRETLSGEFLQVNTALVRELKARGLWTPEVREAIKRSDGSVQGIAEIPEDVRLLFRTAWELPQKALIDIAAARQPYIDQSQSLNLFLASPTIGKLSSMYLYAWKAGLKTTYYLRSRPATRIQQATVSVAAPTPTPTDEEVSDQDAIACSLENPEPARPANDHSGHHPHRDPDAARPGHEPHPAADALPALLRALPRRASRTTGRVEEVDLHSDLKDLQRLTAAERHLVGRLVAFFATGDTIVANNLVLNLYQHINSPEGRLYLSRQLFEEAVHVQFYLTLLDTYVPDERERRRRSTRSTTSRRSRPRPTSASAGSTRCSTSTGSRPRSTARAFLLNVICFAACIEGLFFYGAFAYVYFLRSRGLLNGLASGTNWVFRDESMHMAFAFDVVERCAGGA